MSVVGKYYKFARSTVGAPALFPFADPLKVPTISVYTGRATPLDIHNAIKDAKKYRQTIFLMFHKITDGTPSHQTEYSRKDFEQIMNDINDQGIGVVTLSELDKENAIPESDVILTNESPSQYELDISTSQNISIINIWRWVVSLNFL